MGDGYKISELQHNSNNENLINENKKSKSGNKSFIQKTKDFFYAIKPIALSHHPLCDQFQTGNHTMKLFGKEFCIGCYVTYPVAFLVFLFGEIFGLFSLFSTLDLFYIGFGCCSIYILSIIGLAKTKSIKIITKFIIGIGIAYCFAGIWALNGTIESKILLSIIYLELGHYFINIMRGIAMYKICNTCEYKGNWHACPGMSKIINYSKEKVLTTIKK